MLFFNDKSTPLNIFFLKEEHLAFLKAKSIPFSDLRDLLFFDLNREDVLSWISFQRAVEKKLFNKSFTTYTTSGELKFSGVSPKHDIELLAPLLEQLYSKNKYYEDLPFTSYKVYNGTIVILFKDNPVIDEGFSIGQGSILKTIYHAIIFDLGYHKLYFKDPIRNRDDEGITLSHLIAKLMD